MMMTSLSMQLVRKRHQQFIVTVGMMGQTPAEVENNVTGNP